MIAVAIGSVALVVAALVAYRTRTTKPHSVGAPSRAVGALRAFLGSDRLARSVLAGHVRSATLNPIDPVPTDARSSDGSTDASRPERPPGRTHVTWLMPPGQPRAASNGTVPGPRSAIIDATATLLAGIPLAIAIVFLAVGPWAGPLARLGVAIAAALVGAAAVQRSSRTVPGLLDYAVGGALAIWFGGLILPLSPVAAAGIMMLVLVGVAAGGRALIWRPPTPLGVHVLRATSAAHATSCVVLTVAVSSVGVVLALLVAITTLGGWWVAFRYPSFAPYP